MRPNVRESAMELPEPGYSPKMPHDERPAAYEKTGVHSKSELQLLVGDALSAGDAGRVRD